MTLTLYTNPMSRGRIARWMVEETGAAYDTVVLDYGTTMKADAYLAINPMGKVPAIVHDGRVVTEAAAICAYLADAFPDARLAPETADERAAYYRWLFFTAGPVEAAVINRAFGFEVPEERRATAGYGSYDHAVGVLESVVSGDGWIAGDRFTAADVYVGAQVMWGLQFGTLPKRGAFADYAARLAERDAWRRASAIDDALIAERA